jgi:hypothetical protein
MFAQPDAEHGRDQLDVIATLLDRQMPNVEPFSATPRRTSPWTRWHDLRLARFYPKLCESALGSPRLLAATFDDDGSVMFRRDVVWLRKTPRRSVTGGVRGRVVVLVVSLS